MITSAFIILTVIFYKERGILWNRKRNTTTSSRIFAFTKAAQALNNSQPNITRAMNCLEQQLNTTLFIRTNRGVQLTPEGERLYTHVLSAMEQFQAAEEELADSSGLSHGSVAIGASETALNIFLLDKLKSFHMTYPGIRLKLYNHSTPEARNFPFGR